ncbi:MAG: hypothetical protein ACLGGX_08020 [Bdellovibrionia bacterium]
MKNIIVQSLAVLAFLFIALEGKAQAPQVCTLASEGIAGAAWKKHRLLLGEKVIFGTDDLTEMIQQLDEYRQSGLCQ